MTNEKWRNSGIFRPKVGRVNEKLSREVKQGKVRNQDFWQRMEFWGELAFG